MQTRTQPIDWFVSKVWLACAVLAALTTILRAAPAPGVSFTKIADTSTIIPAGQWAGEKFARFGIPTMKDGRVAFIGSVTSTAEQTGVYAWSDGTLAMLADPSVAPPGGGVLTRFRYPSILANGYAFDTGSSSGRTNGVYRVIDGALTSIGALPVTHTTGTSFDNQDTWFYGYSFHPPPIGGIIDSGIYRAHNSLFQIVVPNGMVPPSAPPEYGFYFVNDEHRVIARDGRVVFWAKSRSATGPEISGLYAIKDGLIERLVDSTMAAPTADMTFSGLYGSPFDFDESTLVFRSGQSIYAQRNGNFEVIATAGQPAPGGGVFAFTGYEYSQVSLDGGCLAFTEGPNPINLPHRIYADIGGSLARIVGRDDVIFGETISNLQIGPDGLSGNQIVFYAKFMSGGSGVFLATIPEPGAAPYAAALAWLLVCVVARQRKPTRSGHERRV